MVALVHLPQPGVFAAPYLVGIRNIVDILDIGFSACAFADQADCIGTGIDPAVHLVIPDADFRTGGSIRALGVDKELVVKVITFIEAGSRGQELLPVFRRPCDFLLGFLGQI
ncbi:hypothetical protein FYJ45_18885 [Eisenbergiella tayi]|uniref:Uncharacterized protein n=1 Tax=Eisenbergiella porci TaxID=2652274 RepID=A0A6N7W4V9_9FIRM|nr:MULTISPECIES: hypothetical protein [Eisenbergiella]MSS90266.1 hypothetical protein [Eisenbergiella porci]